MLSFLITFKTVKEQIIDPEKADQEQHEHREIDGCKAIFDEKEKKIS